MPTDEAIQMTITAAKPSYISGRILGTGQCSICWKRDRQVGQLNCDDWPVRLCAGCLRDLVRVSQELLGILDPLSAEEIGE